MKTILKICGILLLITAVIQLASAIVLSTYLLGSFGNSLLGLRGIMNVITFNKNNDLSID